MQISLWKVGCLAVFMAATMLLPQQTEAQTKKEAQFDVEKSYVRKLGHVRPLREVVNEDYVPVDAEKLSRGDRPTYVRNFTGRRYKEFNNPDALPRGADPLLHQNSMRNGTLSAEPLFTVEGLSQGEVGSGVSDVNGDVSSRYYVQSVNSTWLQVFDLQGNRVGPRFRASTIWEEVGRSSAGDPIILFDEQANRWFMTEFPPQNEVLIAISDTDDPMGGWTAYALSTPRFPDYPKYGIWPEAYVLTTNESGNGLFFYMINRQAILDGEDIVPMQRFSLDEPNAPGFIVATPVGMTGEMLPDSTTKPMLMNLQDDAWGGGDPDQIELFEVTVDWDDESNTLVEQINLPTAPFDAQFCSVPGPNFSCVPQPNGVGIDALPWFVQHRSVYRNFGTHESIVLNFAIDVTGNDEAGIRWMELRKTPGETWSIYQEGTIGTDDGEERFMGGISIDSDGNIGIGYAVSGVNTYPSLRFTGRFAQDPLGLMSIEEFEFGTGKAARTNSRFGDYASMSVDRQDVFWYTGQYMPETQWSTKIVAFKLFKFDHDVGPRELVAPVDAPDLDEEMVTVKIANYGNETVTEFEVGYIFNGQDTVIETANLDSLQADSLYTHEFATPVQFGTFGQYSLAVFTSMDRDSNQLNDTCVFTINKQTQLDAALPQLDEQPTLVCDTFVDVRLVLQNLGTDNLTSAMIHYSINGGDEQSMDWTGNLVSGDVDLIPIYLSGLNAGSNMVTFRVDMPNGMADQNPSNDTLRVDLETTPGEGARVVLELLTDSYPDETTWQLLDSNKAIIDQGGPYDSPMTVYTREWCLDYGQCYTFVLFDSYGDGIDAYGISGDYTIRNEEGIIIARLEDPGFGDVDSTDFCPAFECTMNANAFVRHESGKNANDGSATVLAFGGTPPYLFSADGGETFQSGTQFGDLAPGIYTFVAKDSRDCFLEFEREVLACQTVVDGTVTDASGMDVADGRIEVSATGGNGPVEYSINGGVDYQASNVFDGLLPDTYVVLALDSVMCRVGEIFDVDFTTSVETTPSGQVMRVFPNPSSGDFYIEIEGLQDELFLDYEILDINGKVIDRRKAQNYGGVIRSYFSITSKPAGIYYVKFLHPDLSVPVPAVKY